MRHPRAHRAVKFWGLAALLGAALLAGGWGPTRPCPPLPAPEPELALDEVTTSIFLIGDAGEPAPGGEPVLAALARAVTERSAALGGGEAGRVAVVFLGDNLYPSGLPGLKARSRKEGQRRLDAQLAVFQSAPGVAGIFVPGNHDWDKSGPEGWERVRAQEKYLAGKGPVGVRMLPGGGCPGPATVDVGTDLRLLILDTEWWLRRHPKPEHPTSTCATDSEPEILARLEAELAAAEADGRRAVVVGHHPLITGGPHGGTSSRLRRLGFSAQDTSSRRNRHMVRALEGAFAEHPPLLYAAGHEHSLQLLRPGSFPYQAVSGAGSADNLTSVVALAETLFCRQASGFMRLDLGRGGEARLGIFTVEGSGNTAREGSGNTAREVAAFSLAPLPGAPP